MTNCIGHGGGHLPTGDMFAGLSQSTMMEFFPDEYRRRLKRKTAKKVSTKSKSKSIKSKKSKAKKK